MSHTKASPSLHGVPPPRDAVVRRSVEGVYRETMPAALGRDAEFLQAVLLTPTERRPVSTATLMADWFMRVSEWFGRMWSTCMSMMGLKR